MSDLSYPIGREVVRIELTEAERREAIAVIASTPARFRAAVEGLTDEQLDTPYRPGGWTVRQLVHHLPDSHVNAYIRFKFALAEDEPTIKPYDQDVWAALPDSRTTPVEVSLTLLDSLHQRWVEVLRGMKPEDFRRRLNHPERGVLTLDAMLNSYAWHGLHHVAHVTGLRKRMGWG
jgi:DinB superfamily